MEAHLCLVSRVPFLVGMYSPPVVTGALPLRIKMVMVNLNSEEHTGVT